MIDIKYSEFTIEKFDTHANKYLPQYNRKSGMSSIVFCVISGIVGYILAVTVFCMMHDYFPVERFVRDRNVLSRYVWRIVLSLFTSFCITKGYAKIISLMHRRFFLMIGARLRTSNFLTEYIRRWEEVVEFQALLRNSDIVSVELIESSKIIAKYRKPNSEYLYAKQLELTETQWRQTVRQDRIDFGWVDEEINTCLKNHSLPEYHPEEFAEECS